MIRNLDLTALRSFVSVADTGGVTRAAAQLNLTQSAVSMQLKRLEEALDLALFDRSGRGMSLTGAGEQLLSYARRMIELNDEVYGRLTGRLYEGEIRLGAPHDLVYRVIPQILKSFHAAFPRMRVTLTSTLTKTLKEDFERGEVDMILTTETGTPDGAERLTSLPLIWVGAPGGTAWRERPLRFASEPDCIFRSSVFESLDRAGIPWEVALESRATRAVEAGVEADLAVYVQMAGMTPPTMAPVPHGGALPELPSFSINLYRSPTARGPAQDALAEMVRAGYRALSPAAAPRPSPSPVAAE